MVNMDIDVKNQFLTLKNGLLENKKFLIIYLVLTTIFFVSVKNLTDEFNLISS